MDGLRRRHQRGSDARVSIGSLKSRLQAETVISVNLDHVSPSAVEYLASFPLIDAFSIDLEHSNVADDRVEEIIRVAELSGIPTIVRVPFQEASRMQRLLDAGAIGWKVPDVRHPKMAREAVAVALHPPQGVRGIGRTRSNRYGRDDLVATAHKSNRQTVILAMIESPEGVAAAEEIAAVEGVDCLLVGLVDLAASLGGADEGELSSAIATVASAAERHGKALGLAAGSAQVAARNQEFGARYMTIPLNSLIAAGLQTFASVVRRP